MPVLRLVASMERRPQRSWWNLGNACCGVCPNPSDQSLISRGDTASSLGSPCLLINASLVHRGVRARAILRLIPEVKWDASKILGVETTPLTEHTRWLDTLESKKDPHDVPLADRPVDQQEPSAPRRLRIMLKDVYAHGFTPECPTCSLHQQGDHKRA